MPALSVIINTAPGREQNLAGCLQALSQQSLQDFEVLVADDGSQGAEAIVQAFQAQLSIRYFWRPNDLCVNRSRNLGIAASQSEALVLLDGDCLLNPQGLAIYQQILKAYPKTLWSGYFGYIRQYKSPSSLIPGRMINYLDRRFNVYGLKTFQPTELLRQQPAQSFWGANIAFPKSIWQDLGGFDERFEGWGNNDTDFAFRALEKGYQIHFAIDPWGEHQVHGYHENYHQRFDQPQSSGKQFFETRIHPAVDYQIMVYASPQGINNLCQKIFGYYLQNDLAVSPPIKQLFRQEDIRLLLRSDGKDQWELGWAVPKSN